MGPTCQLATCASCSSVDPTGASSASVVHTGSRAGPSSCRLPPATVSVPPGTVLPPAGRSRHLSPFRAHAPRLGSCPLLQGGAKASLSRWLQGCMPPRSTEVGWWLAQRRMPGHTGCECTAASQTRRIRCLRSNQSWCFPSPKRSAGLQLTQAQVCCCLKNNGHCVRCRLRTVLVAEKGVGAVQDNVSGLQGHVLQTAAAAP